MDKKIIKNNISRNCIASDCIGVISSYTPFKEGNARFTIVPLNLCLGKNYFCLKIDNFILCVLCKIGITNTNLPVNLKDLLTLLFAWRFWNSWRSLFTFRPLGVIMSGLNKWKKLKFISAEKITFPKIKFLLSFNKMFRLYPSNFWYGCEYMR